MEPDTLSLFQRVSQKLGWDRDGLDVVEEKLRQSLKKDRRPGQSSCGASPTLNTGPALGLILTNNSDSEKENLQQPPPSESSDDEEFLQIIAAAATPKPKAKGSTSAVKTHRTPVVVLSSDSDGEFENFLHRVKTPKVKARPRHDSDDGFIVHSMSSDEDFISEKKKTPVKKVKSVTRSVKGKARVAKTPKPAVTPEGLVDLPVFLSDSDEDGDVVIHSTWKSRHSRPPSEQKNTSGKSTLGHDDYSDEEVQSLLDQVRQINSRLHATPKSVPAKPRRPLSTPSADWKKAAEHVFLTPAPPPPPSSIKLLSRTEPRAMAGSNGGASCKTPGCFLQSLSAPGSSYCRSFKQVREDLTSKLFQLYNSSIFDSKLPADMSVTWNKNMRKTAGYCISGQHHGGRKYARIELSVKVCDSADRLRDTLIHEMCHAATWIINGVRDGHGSFWRLYASKAALAHPELPMVTRCHSYDINYKFQYQCSRCKNTIGRHSKSLDTTKFMCALCRGPLVLLTPSRSRAPTPFATYVKENFGSARKEMAGQSHAEVMRKLSADFSSKSRLSQS